MRVPVLDPLVDVDAIALSQHSQPPYCSRPSPISLLLSNVNCQLSFNKHSVFTVSLAMSDLPIPLSSSPARHDAMQGKRSSPISTHAFLVHSPNTVANDLPPDVDNKPLARQKRRRTRYDFISTFLLLMFSPLNTRRVVLHGHARARGRSSAPTNPAPHRTSADPPRIAAKKMRRS